jgi:hypothetical protein
LTICSMLVLVDIITILDPLHNGLFLNNLKIGKMYCHDHYKNST